MICRRLCRENIVDSQQPVDIWRQIIVGDHKS